MERSRAASKDMMMGWVDLADKQHQTTSLKQAGTHDKLDAGWRIIDLSSEDPYVLTTNQS